MRRPLLWVVVVLLVVGGAGALLRLRPPAAPGSAAAVGREPRLSPDYAGAWLPGNLAPPQFTVNEPGSAYYLRVEVAGGGACSVGSRRARLALPPAAWRRAIGTARPATVSFEVCVRDAAGHWSRFEPFTCTLAEPIDRYLTYREIGPVHAYYRNTAVRQRDLQGRRDRAVLAGAHFGNGCTNCHTYQGGQTARMTLGVRSASYGNAALLVTDGRVTTLDANWGYNTWHPGGQAVAYSLNKVRQFFHDSSAEAREALDLDSDLLLYRADTKTVEASPAIADPQLLETYPCWSADGRYLYFCSAPITWQDRNTVPPVGYQTVRYDLRRVTYDLASHRFGRPETVLAARDLGGSITQPRVSPDGRWLAFCLCDRSCFPVFRASSDLYLLDLRSGRYHPLTAANSPQSESWHSWSSNSRWLAFSSKRADGLFTRTYLAYVDARGQARKPAPIPGQPDGADAYLEVHNVPELSVGPVTVSPRALAAAARSPRRVKLQLPEVSMTRKKAAAPSEPYEVRRR